MTNRTTRREANRLRLEILEGVAERQERATTSRRVRRCGTVAREFPPWSIPQAYARMLPWKFLNAAAPFGAPACLN